MQIYIIRIDNTEKVINYSTAPGHLILTAHSLTFAIKSKRWCDKLISMTREILTSNSV